MQKTPILEVDCAVKVGAFSLHPQFSLYAPFSALFGPSGCGKTSTLKLIAGLIAPAQGRVQLHGKPLCDTGKKVHVPPHAREIGLVFQDGRLFPHLSVRENLTFGSRQSAAEKHHLRLNDVIEVLRIGHLLDRMPTTLSGGETQRVAIGRALLAAPRLLLMDEPLAAVDIPAKLALLTELRRIHDAFQIPIVYVSHDLGTVLNIASHVLHMRQGRIVAEGRPFEVLADYVHKPLMATDAIRNLLEIRIRRHDETSGTTEVVCGENVFILPKIDSQPGEKLHIDIPASEIILAVQKPLGLSARNILAGRVVAIHHFGSRVIVRVDIGIVLSVEIVEGTLSGLEISEGKQVFLVIKATAFRRIG